MGASKNQCENVHQRYVANLRFGKNFNLFPTLLTTAYWSLISLHPRADLVIL